MISAARLENWQAAAQAAAVPSRAEAVCELLRDAIIAGELPPGMALRQDRLAQSLGISKIPLREALARLESEGFVASDPGRGMTVTPVSPERVQEIFLLRHLMELELLAAALPMMTPEALAEARQAAAEFDTAPVAQLSRINWRFHSALYRPSGRVLSLEILRGLFLHAERYVQLHMATLDQDRAANRDHYRLLEAIAAGRPHEACGILRDHLSGIGRMIGDYAAAQIEQAEQQGDPT